MSNVTYLSTNHPVGTSPIEFDITPVAPFWISEVLVYLKTSYPPPQASGTIKTGSQSHPSKLTIFVDQAIFTQICSCLGGTVDISIDYSGDQVTYVSCSAAPMHAGFAGLDEKLAGIAKTSSL